MSTSNTENSVRATIKPLSDGPLVVKNLKEISGLDGTPNPVMVLCRCGLSKNKPYCDNSHKEAGFSSENTRASGRDRMLKYEGAEATVFFNPMLCGHAAECGRLAKNIFDPAQKPWVQPDKGTVAQVESVVAACPSGALTYADSKGDPVHVVEKRPQVIVQKDGPYWVTDVDIEAPLQGEGMSARKFVLCRCGQSGNKPYCDGSHRDNGWKDGSKA